MLGLLKKNNSYIVKIDLLLNLAQFHIFKPGEEKIDFDSANTYINAAATLNKKLQSPDASGYQLLTQAFMLKEQGQHDEAMKMVENAIRFLEQGKNKSYLGKAYYELSQFYDYSKRGEELAKMISLVQKSVAAFQQTPDMERKAFSLKMLGDLYSIQNDNQKAIEVLRLALRVYDSIHYQKLQGVYSLIGRIYTEENDYKQALQYELMALRAAENDNDSSMELCAINNNIGLIYSNLQQFEMALKYFKDAISVAIRHKDKYTIAFLMPGISGMYASTNRPDEGIEFLETIPRAYLDTGKVLEKVFINLAYFRVYIEARRINNAKPYLNTLLKLVDNNEIYTDLKNNIYRSVTRYYIEAKQFAPAHVYLAKTMTLSEGFGGQRLLLAIKLMYKLDSAEGNFRSAYNHFRRYKNLADSILNAGKAKQIRQLEVEYETAKKEDSIRLKDKDIALLRRENSLQEVNLKQAAFVKKVTIAGIIAVLIIASLLYKQSRMRKINNKVTMHKNELLEHLLTEKEWLLKEIHHRVKNNLQIVMSLLNSQSAYIDNDAALTAIHDSQHRVHAMSLIHQKLYNTENVSSIDMSFYIRELASYLSDSFSIGQRIRFELTVEPVELDVSQAVPLGLILNEAITNSIKYAFPGGRNGTITISLSDSGAHHYLLVISDNGIGIPQLNSNKSGSLGITLMRGLSEDIDGDFSIVNDNGTVIKISFLHDHVVKTVDTLATANISNN